MSSYDLYYADWASSPDHEFASQDRYPFVGGEFVWTGWDYLGEPTPFDTSRSSYFGIIDLAGFHEGPLLSLPSALASRFPDGAHPAALDLAGARSARSRRSTSTPPAMRRNSSSTANRSVARKKAEFEYRLRWDDVIYEPGELQRRRLQERQTVGHRLRQDHRRCRQNCR